MIAPGERQKGSGKAGLGFPMSARTKSDRGQTEGAARRRPKLLLLLADLTNEFRLSRSSKPEEPGSRPASWPEFCVYDTLPPPGPPPLPYMGLRESYLRASLPQYPDASGGRGKLVHSSLHRFQGCEGFVDTGITSGSFLPSLPTPRDRGTVAKAAPRQPQCPPD